MTAGIVSLPVKRCHLLPWKWQFWSDRRWHQTALISAAMWIVGTMLIIPAKAMIQGWEAIIVVGLLLDSVMWAAGKIWIFNDCRVDAEVSAGRNLVVWAGFFLVNLSLTWTLTHPGDLGTMHTRFVLVVYGVLINPVRFRINKELVFGHSSLKRAAQKLCRFTKKTKR